MSFPTPFHPIHPHTMRLFPPPCLTVGVVVLSESGSPFCFQVYTLPSDPILLIFVYPFPVLHCPVFMILGKSKPVISIGLFEKMTFLLDNRAKIVFFECISDCWGCDRSREDVVDKMGGL